MTDDQDRPRLLGFAAQIVSAHVSKNAVAAQELPPLIEKVYEALRNAGAEPAVEPARPEPAAPIKKSVFPDYLICLEDGKKLKMLKRHLRTAYNMSPEEYRKRWGLLRQASLRAGEADRARHPPADRGARGTVIGATGQAAIAPGRRAEGSRRAQARPHHAGVAVGGYSGLTENIPAFRMSPPLRPDGRHMRRQC